MRIIKAIKPAPIMAKRCESCAPAEKNITKETIMISPRVPTSGCLSIKKPMQERTVINGMSPSRTFPTLFCPLLESYAARYTITASLAISEG